MFYSAQTGGFYCKEIHGSAMPGDVVPISDALYATVAGQQIVTGPDGLPALYIAPPPTLAERAAAMLVRIDEHLNEPARAKGYDDIRSAALRAGYPGPFHDEGVAFATWMDATYATCYQLIAQVQAGTLAEPSFDELLAMLPVLSLPS